LKFEFVLPGRIQTIPMQHTEIITDILLFPLLLFSEILRWNDWGNIYNVFELPKIDRQV